MAETNFDDQLLREHVKSGRNDEVMSLLQGVDPCRYVDKCKSTLLHLAAEYDNIDLAQYLIKLGADLHAKNNLGHTPLVVAVNNQHEELIKILLEAGADVSIPDVYEKCLLARVFSRRHEMKKSMKELILNSVTVDNFRKSPCTWTKAFHNNCPLYNFISFKNIEMTRLLLERGSPVNVADPHTGTTALHVAVENLDVEQVKLLLEHRADVLAKNHLGIAPLGLISHNSSDDKSLEIVKFLINAGASLTDFGASQLLSNGNRQLIRAVLQCKPDLFAGNARSGSVPMAYLLENKDPGVYEELKSLKIDVTFRFGNNATLLHHVSEKNNLIAIKFLMDHGADVNAKDNDNLTPLHHVAAKDNPIAMKLLIDRGADVNAKNNANLTPLHIAVNLYNNRERRSHTALVCSAHVDKKPEREKYLKRCCKCVFMLLEKGADPQIFTRDINYSYIEVLNYYPIIDLACELMWPVLAYLTLDEESGRPINEFMLTEIKKRPKLQAVFDSSKQQLAEIKQIQLDESVTMFDFLTSKWVSQYTHNNALVSNLTNVVNGFNADSYYYRMLQKRFLKFSRIVAINEIFVKFYNRSAADVAERIVNYM